MTDATDATASEAAHRLLTERVAAIEKIMLLLPVVLAEVAIILSLFIPYLTTRVEGEDETVSFLTFPFVMLTSTDEGAPGGIEVAFSIAFIVLLLAIVAAMVAIAPIPRDRRSEGATRIITGLVVLLMVGVAGAWLVAFIAVTSATPGELGPGLPLLTVGTLIAALVTRVPAYRSIWAAGPPLRV